MEHPSVAGTADRTFDPKAFLAAESRGRRISRYHKDAVVFAQADPANAVFYVQKGKIKIVTMSEQGKEAVVGLIGGGSFLAKAACWASLCVWRAPESWPIAK